MEYWRENPPIHLVGKYAWFKAKDGDDSQPAVSPEANATAQQMLAGTIAGSGSRKLSALPAGVQRGIMSAIGAK